jgi:hypothetical protein
MLSMPLAWMYWRSLSVNLNRDRDRSLDFFRAVRAGGDLVGHIGVLFGPVEFVFLAI